VGRNVFSWAVFLTAILANAAAFAQDQYDLLFSEASYSSPEQRNLNYSSFVGDRQTGAIYSCSGTIYLDPRTGDVLRQTGKCMNAYIPPPGTTGEYTFGRLSALDATAKANSPRMNPAWGFWRIDQVKRMYAFCTRHGTQPHWSCFDSPLP
jgi:hypothetical protein